ncbi:hypothetical protein AAKU55_003120 [Oxalobacteraceae bacterium GrIS 1.11]
MVFWMVFYSQRNIVDFSKLSRLVGMVVGTLMALLLASLALFALLTPNLGYGGIGLIFIAIGVGGPLLLLNAGLSLLVLRKPGAGRALLWMWLPSMVVLAIIAVYVTGARWSGELFQRAHPNIREVHINLSGRTLWLDPESTVNEPVPAMPAEAPEKFATLTRYSRKYYGQDRMQAYQGARLADGFKQMPVYYGDPGATPPTPPTMLPVVAAAYPDLASFVSKLSFQTGNDAVVAVFLYYHYADRVEVAPSFELSGMDATDLWGQDVPVVNFQFHNLGARPIARVEIDGQAIHFGAGAISATPTGEPCAGYPAHGINRLTAPLLVRWQYAQANPLWQTAKVALPTFKNAKFGKGKLRFDGVDLYFQDGAGPVAERSQEVDLGGDKVGFRSAGVVPPAGAACEAWSRYNDNVVHLAP